MQFPQTCKEFRGARPGLAGLVPAVVLVLFVALLAGLPGPALAQAGPVQTIPAGSADWTPLVDRLAADGVSPALTRELFSRPETAFYPEAMSSKLAALLRRRAEGPTRAKKPTGVYKGFLNPEVIAKAKAFMHEHAADLAPVEARYGVPREVVVALMLVETKFGDYVGTKPAFNTLASMALSGDLDRVEPYLAPGLLTADSRAFAQDALRRKSAWAYDELKALIAYAANTRQDPLAIPGSVYGAIGLCQFMPSNVPLYGVAAAGGHPDLFKPCDAIHSVASYLRGHGWRPGLGPEGRHRVVMTYNHSTVYANTVLAVADRIAGKPAPKAKPAKKKTRKA
jgi:membrane-bound lytic murein transglycosylase B